jgi:hypothetical protein
MAMELELHMDASSKEKQRDYVCHVLGFTGRHIGSEL